MCLLLPGKQLQAYKQNKMKAIKINTEVNLNTGLQLDPGSVVILYNGSAALNGMVKDIIPCTIVTGVYVSELFYLEGKGQVDPGSILDFNTQNYYNLTLKAYQTETAEDLLTNAVLQYLDNVYPGNVEIIIL